jgi:hypothetical protein
LNPVAALNLAWNAEEVKVSILRRPPATLVVPWAA